MRSLIIEATEDSPEIKFDFISRQFIISGKSRPENTGKFFAPVLNWFGEFEKSLSSEQNNDSLKSSPLDFTFKLEYFNSISAKYIADIIIFYYF